MDQIERASNSDMDPPGTYRRVFARLNLKLELCKHKLGHGLEGFSIMPAKARRNMPHPEVCHCMLRSRRLALQAPRQLQPMRKSVSRELLENLQLAGTFSDSHGVSDFYL